MRPEDDQIRVHVDHDLAEPGGAFTGTLRRVPIDGTQPVDGAIPIGGARTIRIALHVRTEGRGDVDERTMGEVGVELDRFGSGSTPFSLPVPPDGPISYDGRLIRVIWEIEATTDRRFALDSKATTRVLVVPNGGVGTYQYPHPLNRTW